MQNTLILNQPFVIKKISLKINLKIFWILSLISIISLLVFYIFQMNLLFTQTYLIQNYEKKFNQLLKENQALEINSIQANSLGDIEAQIQQLGFEKVEDIEYIRVLESTVVRGNENKE